MNTILQKRIEEAAFQESSMYDTIQEKNAAFNATIKAATFILQNQWISVDEALPEEDEQIIAMSEFGDIERMKYHNKAFYHLKGSIIKDGEKITHWMENPSLKGSKDE